MAEARPRGMSKAPRGLIALAALARTGARAIISCIEHRSGSILRRRGEMMAGRREGDDRGRGSELWWW